MKKLLCLGVLLFMLPIMAYSKIEGNRDQITFDSLTSTYTWADTQLYKSSGGVISGWMRFADVVINQSSMSATDIQATNKVYVANAVEHIGDSNTKINFTPDKLVVQAGGIDIIEGEQSGVDEVRLANDADWECIQIFDPARQSTWTGTGLMLRGYMVATGSVTADSYFAGDGSTLTSFDRKLSTSVISDGNQSIETSAGERIEFFDFFGAGITAFSMYSDFTPTYDGYTFLCDGALMAISDLTSGNSCMQFSTRAITSHALYFRPNKNVGESNAGCLGEDDKRWAVGWIETLKSTQIISTHGEFSDVAITSRPCAYFAYFLNGSSVTTIAANVFTVACGSGTMLPLSAWFDGEADACGNNNRITYKGATTKKFAISVDGCLQTDAANPTTPSIALYENGSVVPLAEVSPYLSTQNKDTGFGINAIVELATSDYLEIWLTTDDGDDLLIDHITIIVTAID